MTAPLLIVTIAASSIAGLSALFGRSALGFVDTFNRAVHGRNRLARTLDAVLHTLAATATAGAFGAALGAFGALLGAPWGASSDLVIALIAAAAAVHELAGTPFPIPRLRRQVPGLWGTLPGPNAAGALSGASLGFGSLTYLTRATLAVVGVAAFASGSPVTGLVLLAPFGLVCGASVSVASWGPREDVVHRLARLGRHPALPIANGAVAATVALTAILQTRARPMPVAEVASAGLAIAFAWSSAWKIARVGAWLRVLPSYLLGSATRPAAIAVPALEAAVPALVLVRSPVAAGALALALLVAFSLAVLRVRILGGARVRCGCFGTAERTTNEILLRNAAFGALAAVATAAGGTGAPALALPETGQVLPFLMTLGGLVSITAIALEVRRSLR